MNGHIEASGSEWREFALNGDDGPRMEGCFSLRWLSLWQSDGAVAASDIVEDALDKDDADVNAAGDVGQELVKEIVDRIEGIAREDSGDGGSSIRVNAGDVEIVD